MHITRRGGAVASAVAVSLLLASCNGDDTYTPEQNHQALVRRHRDEEHLRRRQRRPAHRRPRQDRPRGRRRRRRRLRRRPPRRSCAGSRSTTTIARSSTSPPTAATARCTARTSTPTATRRSAKARSRAPSTSPTPTTASGKLNVTMMVQIPDVVRRSKRVHRRPAPSSGSRGVYGAIGTAGEWGLKRGCVVAYTDKGTGNGVHDLATDTVNLQNGTRSSAAAAGKNSNFTAELHRLRARGVQRGVAQPLATKHAHSQQNPEKDWGRDTLDAIRFAFYVLNEERAARNTDGTAKVDFKPANTIVIASSVSNGGGAVDRRRRAGHGRPDRRRRRRRADVELRRRRRPRRRARHDDRAAGRASALRLLHARQPATCGCASQSPRAANSSGVAAVRARPAFATNRARASRRRVS